jgi:hypothetical protein
MLERYVVRLLRVDSTGWRQSKSRMKVAMLTRRHFAQRA